MTALLVATGGWSSVTLADWTGKGEGGLVLSRGNSDSTSLNAKIDAAEDLGEWKYVMGAAGLYGKNAEFVTAERIEARFEIDRKLSDRHYVFTAAHAQKDLFEGFDYQATVSAGVGYKFIDDDATKLSGTLGVGYRRLRQQELVTAPDGHVTDRINLEAKGGGVVATGLNFEHKATASTKLVDKFLVESGAANTAVGNDFGVQVSMSERLALSVGYGIRHNSDPAPGTKKLDQLTTANVVYTIK
jgi:putative salt-induced outer membrane protein